MHGALCRLCAVGGDVAAVRGWPFIAELDRYVPTRTWLLRFPILFIFAGEIAKLRCAQAPSCTGECQKGFQR